MGKRRLAREQALKFLYQIDILSRDKNKQKLDVDGELKNFSIIDNLPADKDIKEFMVFLVKGVCANIERIDKIISQHSDNWKISRMSRIDRNVLRIAVYEMTEMSNIPYAVTINEAVDIAKKYGTGESGSFINGVIDKVKLAFEQGEQQNDK